MNTELPETPETIEQLRREVSTVLSIESVTVSRRRPETISFRGQLLVSPSDAFALLRPRFETLGFTPTFTRAEGRDVVSALPGVVWARESNPMINLVLFLLTVLTTLWTGAINEGYDPLQNPANLLQGVPFSFTLLAILGVHEFGHYFMARRYKAPVTLPYFIPLPPGLGLGTMGAVIRLKAPFMDRRSLFDVGIAGPLAGLAVAVPLLFWGLSQSQVGPLQPGGLQEGNSIFYAFAKFVVFGKFLPGGGEDVFISSTAFAAWLGLFITALNLLPAGQLDGGHVAYALLGEKSRYLGGIVIGLLVILGLPLGDLLGIPYPGYAGWFTWVLFIVVFGLAHPTPLNDLTDLGMPRRLLGAFSWFLFIILFTPLPFS